MRVRASIVLALLAGACTKNTQSADEAAKKQAEALDQANGVKPAEKMHPPVSNEAKIPCSQLINVAPFQTALGETDPLTVEDVTKTQAEAAASCSLVKGGKKLTAKEQDALSKKHGQRLGVLPGDAICNVTAFCWTVENEDAFEKRCQQQGKREDRSMGQFACLQVVAEGEDDVNVFRFLDEDSKCILEVRGGPSEVDNNKILACAKTARDAIGPDQIKVSAPAPTP